MNVSVLDNMIRTWTYQVTQYRVSRDVRLRYASLPE